MDKAKPGRHTHGLGERAAPPEDDPRVHTAAAMFQALGDPARLQLMLLLREREVCVSEIVELGYGKLSSISARLQILHAAHLVRRRKDAKHVLYRLADDHVISMLDDMLKHASETH